MNNLKHPKFLCILFGLSLRTKIYEVYCPRLLYASLADAKEADLFTTTAREGLVQCCCADTLNIVFPLVNQASRR